jgi:hypothetical protein
MTPTLEVLVLICTIMLPNGQTGTTESPHFYSKVACLSHWDASDREHCSCTSIEKRPQQSN